MREFVLSMRVLHGRNELFVAVTVARKTDRGRHKFGGTLCLSTIVEALAGLHL